MDDFSIEEHIWKEEDVREYYGLSKGDRLVHLVLPHYNGKYDLMRAYLSIMERTLFPFVITIIDDGSNRDDEGFKFISNLIKNGRPRRVNIVLNSRNRGVTKNLNYGFGIYPELDCVRLDADIEIQSLHWLDEIVKFIDKNEVVGVVAPICLKPDFATVVACGQRIVISPDDNKNIPHFAFEVFDYFGQSRMIFSGAVEVDSVLGCCAYYKRDVIDKVGGIDEDYFGWVEDNDFCIHARYLGYKVFVLPHVSFAHHEHAPKRSYEERKKILKDSEQHFIDKWGFSLYDPAPYWKEIVEKHKDNGILWRYNDILNSEEYKSGAISYETNGRKQKTKKTK